MVRRGRSPSGGRGRVPLYADPRTLIAFSEGSSEYATYLARLERVATRYSYVSAASNDYATFVSAFDALSAGDQTGAVMANVETPWLEMLMTTDAEGKDAAWLTDPAVVSEASRQGVTIGAGTTLDQYKAIGIKLWRDCADYARSRGCTRIIHYASPSWSFSFTGGPPRAGVRPNATGQTCWPAGPSDAFDDFSAAGELWALFAAQANSDAFGAGFYSFCPTSDDYSQLVESTTLAAYGWGRTLADGTTPASTDFDLDSLRYWTGQNSRAMAAKLRKWLSYWSATESASRWGYGSRNRIAAIVFPCGNNANRDNFVDYHHWSGMGVKDPSETAACELGAMFYDLDDNQLAGVADNGRADEVWIWDSAAFYHITQFVSQVGTGSTEAQKLIMRERCAMEKLVFGRPIVGTGEAAILGSTDVADHDTWYASNCMPDSTCNTTTAYWWKLVGGNQLPSPCVLDQSSPLAEWLDFSADIKQPAGVNALRHFVSDRNVTTVELCRAAMDAAGR